MSIVTTVIVITNTSFEDPKVAQLFAFTGCSIREPLDYKQIPDDAFGGYKVPECDIYGGAYNHLDIEGFFAHAATIFTESHEHCMICCYTSAPVDGFAAWKWDPEPRYY